MGRDMGALLESGAGSDVTFKVEGELTQAHRIILQVCPQHLSVTEVMAAQVIAASIALQNPRVAPSQHTACPGVARLSTAVLQKLGACSLTIRFCN